MDITRGSLDEISRPASSSRINHGNKVLSTSLEILTPEPDLPKVDFYHNRTEDNSQENLEENGAKKFRASEEISNGKSSNSFEVIIQSTNQVEEYSSSPGNSGDDCAANELSSSGSGPPNKLATLQNVTTKLTNQEETKKKDADPLILKAMKKMKRLDQILANKQSQEKAVKKQGKEMRKKLWEELECMASRSSSVIVEEVENTSRFLALTSPLPETPESSTAEAEMFVSVFHTQIHPENYECDRRTTKQGESSLIEESARSSIKKIENMHQKSKTNCKKPPDFVKKNIELVKDSANQVVMLEEEKKRLSELLRETETESTELQVIEEEAAGSLVPGEGYTPEPMEYHHLTEINAKLKVMISEEDLPSIQSSCSEMPKQIFQESLAYANRKLETIPGEKVLRDSKEERNQQNRLKEIDQQLKNLEETPDVLPRLSEDQLSALLEECVQTLRRVNSLALTKSQESFFEGTSPHYDIVQNTIPNSRNELLDDVQSGRMLVSQEMVASEDKDMSSADTMETCGFKFSKPLVESHLTEQKENDNEEVQEKMVPSNASEGYFMSLALSTDKPKKPFLDETFLCISPNNELSTDVSIPSMPLKTREDELTDEDGNEK